MKKQPKKPTKQPINQRIISRIKEEKISVIVLGLAMVVFVVAVLCVHSKNIPFGPAEIYSVDGDERVEYEKATVTKVLSQELKVDEAADGGYLGEQQLSVIVKSGRYKNESMTVPYYLGPLSGVPASVGESVTLTIKTHSGGEHSATVFEINRVPALAFFVGLFFIVVIIVGGLTGLKSLVGLIVTVICLFTVLIPVLVEGAPTILTTFIVCTYIALVSFTILGGVHRKTMSAFLGTVSGVFFAMVFGLVMQSYAKVDGLRFDDSEGLLQLKYIGMPVGLRGLLVAGIIISALGAVMDVAMSISSSLEEVYAVNPRLSRRELFKSGMNIGRDMAGTMTNTLILAFLGSEFTLMIFLYARGFTFYHLLSTAFVAVETITGISSSIGLILAIPLTALISSTLIAREKKRKLHRHK